MTDGAMLLISDLLNDKRSTRLKKVLAIYNHHAQASASGQVDMFTGSVKTKTEILSEVYQLLGCDAEIRDLMGTAVRARTEAAKQARAAEIPQHTEPAEPTFAEKLREALLKHYKAAA
jgi:hypothetical protein